jgi:ClpP class serine protease
MKNSLYLPGTPYYFHGDLPAMLLQREKTREGRMAAFQALNLDIQGADDPTGSYFVNRTGQQTFIHPQVQKSGGVAYLKMSGFVDQDIDDFDAYFGGGIDLTVVKAQMANVAADDSIDTLILDFDTPGGNAQGVEAGANSILAVAAAGKTVLGYSKTCCASAGYFLACACDELFSDPDAIWGSISTIATGIDSSRAYEMAGLKLELFATGNLKAAGMPGKPWTDDERNFIRDRGLVVDKVFKDFVSQQRGLDPQYMQGGYWYARAAPDNLIDGIVSSLSDLIEAAMAPQD